MSKDEPVPSYTSTMDSGFTLVSEKVPGGWEASPAKSSTWSFDMLETTSKRIRLLFEKEETKLQRELSLSSHESLQLSHKSHASVQSETYSGLVFVSEPSMKELSIKEFEDHTSLHSVDLLSEVVVEEAVSEASCLVSEIESEHQHIDRDNGKVLSLSHESSNDEDTIHAPETIKSPIEISFPRKVLKSSKLPRLKTFIISKIKARFTKSKPQPVPA